MYLFLRGCFDFIKVLFRETNPAPIKYAMSLAGLCSADIRLPLYTPKMDTQDAIKYEMERLGFIS